MHARAEEYSNEEAGGSFLKGKRIGGRWCSSRSTGHRVQKVKWEIEKDCRKMIRNVADNDHILRTSVHKILRQNLEMKKVRSKMVLKVLTLEQKRGRVFIAETFLQNCEADSTLLGRIISGFQIWFVHKTSVNEVEGEWQTTSRGSSHGSVPAQINVNFIFRRPRNGDGGIGATQEKCSCCFLYRNAPYIENLSERRGWSCGLRTCSCSTTTTPPADSM